MQALFEGIWDKYDGSALESEINGMFFTEAPQGQTYPYCVYHLISDVPSWTFDADMENYLIQFNLYSDKNSSTEINTAFTALTTNLYDWCTLNIDGYHHIYMKREFSNLTRESDIWNYFVQYRLEVQKE